MGARRFERWQFGNAAADEQHEQGRQDAKEEHRAPAKCEVAERAAIKQAIGDRGKQEAAWIAALENPGNQSSRPRRVDFHRQ